jgi:hypothetical protein
MQALKTEKDASHAKFAHAVRVAKGATSQTQHNSSFFVKGTPVDGNM